MEKCPFRSGKAHCKDMPGDAKTVIHKEGVSQRWLRFAKETKISEYDLRFDNILAFLEFLRTTVQTYAMVKRAHEMLVVLRKISR